MDRWTHEHSILEQLEIFNQAQPFRHPILPLDGRPLRLERQLLPMRLPGLSWADPHGLLRMVPLLLTVTSQV